MSRVITLANQIASALADYHAGVQFIPDFRLNQAEDMQIVVVPAGTEFKALSRATYEEKPCVHLGFIKRATEDNVPQLITFTQNLGKSFLNRRFDECICTNVVYDPIYSPTHLREKGLFVSIIELTFKAAGQ